MEWNGVEWNGIWSIPFKILKHGMENRKIWNGKLKNMEWKIENHEVD